MSQGRPVDGWGHGREGYRSVAAGPRASIEVRMQPHVLPTLAVLLSGADDRLDGELRLAAVRTQAAVVRTLVDDVERLTLAHQGAPLRELLEEIARLARTVLACGALDSPGGPRRQRTAP